MTSLNGELEVRQYDSGNEKIIEGNGGKSGREREGKREAGRESGRGRE